MLLVVAGHHEQSAGGSALTVRGCELVAIRLGVPERSVPRASPDDL